MATDSYFFLFCFLLLYSGNRSLKKSESLSNMIFIILLQIEMDNLSFSTIGKNPNLPSISGYVFVKRKMFWAQRYASITGGKLYYFAEKDDGIPRGVIKLKEAILNVNPKTEIIELKTRISTLASLLIKIPSKSFRQTFVQCIRQHMKQEIQSQYEQQESISYYSMKKEQEELLKYPDLPEVFKSLPEHTYKYKSISKGYIEMQTQPELKFSFVKAIWQSIEQYRQQLDNVFFGCLCIISLFLSYLFSPTFLLVVIGMLPKILNKYSRTSKESIVFYKSELIINENSSSIIYAVKQKRQEFFLKEEDKAYTRHLKQDVYKDSTKIYIVEKIQDKLKYFWEINSSANQSIVTLVYDNKSPAINLALLEFAIVRSRVNQGYRISPFPLVTNTEQEVSQKNMIKEEIETESINKTIDNINKPVVDKPIQLLSQIQIHRQFPEIPEHLIKQVMISRNRYAENLSEWSDSENKNNCILSIRQRNGLLATKGVTILKGDLEKIVEYLTDLQKRSEYDKMYNKGFMVKDYVHCGIVYQRFNGIYPVDARDFVLLLSKQRTPNGYIVHGKSIAYDVKNQPKTVRATLISGGFEILQLPEGKVKITYITQSDPAGSLPGFVKKQAGKMQSSVIINIRQILIKRFPQ